MRKESWITPLRWLAAFIVLTAMAGCGEGDSSSNGPLGVSSVVPANNAVAVATSSNVNATFSEAVDSATVNTTTFTVNEGGGAAVAGTVNQQGLTATFTPTSPLTASTSYSARIKGGAAGVRNLAGTPLPGDFVWQWTTAAATTDSTPPTVILRVPANGTQLVCTGSTIRAVFSEAMDPQTINATTFTLAQTTGTAAPGNVAYDPVTRTATLTPDALLLGPGVDYTVRLRGDPTGTSGATAVTDLAGNPLALDDTWQFQSGGACP